MEHMKKGILMALIGLLTLQAGAQEKKLYDPKADAAADIAATVAKAKAEHKFVLIQAGGNWCGWCLEFARLAKADVQIDSTIKASFVWYHLNYSPENRNTAIFTQYGYPQRFGFPAFIILNERGKRIHTQNSEYLEDGKKSYDKQKVLDFLKAWSPDAFDPVLNKYN